MKRSRLILVAGAATVALAAAAGCGGDDSSAADEWAEGVCSSVVTWKDSVASAGESLKGGGSGEGAVDQITGATTQLADDLEGLGAPDTEAGTEAQELVTSLADTIGESIDAIETALADADDTGSLAAVTAVTAALGAVGEVLSTTVEQLGELQAGEELQDAFDDAESCQELRGDR